MLSPPTLEDEKEGEKSAGGGFLGPQRSLNPDLITPSAHLLAGRASHADRLFTRAPTEDAGTGGRGPGKSHWGGRALAPPLPADLRAGAGALGGASGSLARLR